MSYPAGLTKTMTSHSDFVGDVQQLQKMKTGDDKESLERVAKEFESVYLKMMLDSMRAAEKVWSKDNPLSSSEQDMFRDMLDGQLTKDISKSGSLGLADMLVRQLSPFVHDPKPDQTPAKGLNPLALPKRAVPPTAPEQDPQRPLSSVDAISQNQRPTLTNTDLPNAPISNHMDASHIDIERIAGNPEAFADAIMPFAQRAGAKLGVDPKLIVAQAALETGWGKSLRRSEHGYNFFGIKAGSSWNGDKALHPTHEVYNQKVVKEQGIFRHYAAPQESFDDYVQLIQQRFGRALDDGSADAFAHGLADAGYATDPEYADKIMAIYTGPRLNGHASSSELQLASSEIERADPRTAIW